MIIYLYKFILNHVFFLFIILIFSDFNFGYINFISKKNICKKMNKFFLKEL